MSFGSTSEDIDGVAKDLDRGPPEERAMTEAELRGSMKDIATAKATMGELATVKGLSEQVKFMQHQMDELMEANNRLVNLVSTLQAEFDQFRQQRAIELQGWLAKGGSTTREDVMDGAQS